MIANETKYASFTTVACFAVFVVAFARTGLAKSMFIIPIAMLLPFVVYFRFKPKGFFRSPEALMNEAPSAIGIFSNVLFSGGSFDTAVRTIAESGPKHSSALFGKIVKDTDCRLCSDIRTGVKDAFSNAPKELSPFRRAMVIVMTAFDSDNGGSMMKEAENIVLSGLKEMGESYSARLNTPCMIVFGVGIMIPMILISILPMMSVGGMFSTSIKTEVVVAVTLIAVPVFVLGVILMLRGKNPFFGYSVKPKEYLSLIPLLSFVPIFMLLKDRLGFEKAFVISAVAASLISAVAISSHVISERKRCKTESMLNDALFELSNRLCMGENFDVALKGSLSARKDCEPFRLRTEREIDLCRGDIKHALLTVISPVSRELAGFYSDIYSASKRDIRNAGKMALGIAHQIQNQNTVRKGIELKLKNMLDMMTGTAALFAPLILGMSVVMLGPISNISGTDTLADIRPVLTVYLVELCALISILSSNLMCRGKVIDIQLRFSLMLPISLLVFTACCGITI